MTGRVPVSERMPAYPWDALVADRALASAHPGGIVDLSVGTPVDPTPDVVQRALRAAADAPGYPAVWGTPQLRGAIISYLERRWGAVGLTEEGVLPTLGSKELIASLPTHLGLGGTTILAPALAYPTYAAGAALAGADVIRSDSTVGAGPVRVSLLWINTPANPHGKVLPLDHLRKVVAWARERGTIVASDECYLEFGWEAEPLSILHPDVNGGSLDGLLAVHSLSKRSNLAGYRAAYVAGDPAIVSELLAVRRHGGLIPPAPVQAAMVAALDDHEHVVEQRARYLGRRRLLRAALEGVGFTIDQSEGSLYLWATRDEPAEATCRWLAERGILVAPGSMYGAPGARHVRVALTATDERILAAVSRLT